MTPRGSLAAQREALLDLARRVRRLRPDWRDPRRFYAEREAIEDALAELASAAPAGADRLAGAVRCGRR